MPDLPEEQSFVRRLTTLGSCKSHVSEDLQILDLFPYTYFLPLVLVALKGNV